MQLKPAQLDTHLAQQLAPCYLISGDEPLLVQECADAIRSAARAGAVPKDSASTSPEKTIGWSWGMPPDRYLYSQSGN